MDFFLGQNKKKINKFTLSFKITSYVLIDPLCLNRNVLSRKARYKWLKSKKINVYLSVFWFHPAPKKQRWVYGPEADKVIEFQRGWQEHSEAWLQHNCSSPISVKRAEWRDEEVLRLKSTFEKHALREKNLYF